MQAIQILADVSWSKVLFVSLSLSGLLLLIAEVF